MENYLQKNCLYDTTTRAGHETMNNLYGFGADGHGIVDDQTYTFDFYNKGKIST